MLIFRRMQIIWHGLSSFEVKAKTTNGDITIVTDPYQNTTGLRFPKAISAELAISSHDGEDANNYGVVSGEPYVVDLPGEFEVKNIFVFGVDAPLKAGGKNFVSVIEAERMRIAHLGALDRALSDEELQRMNNIDILMVPVGGGRVMDAKVASEVISQVEPRVVIPMTHALPAMKEKLATVESFCKELGACRREEVSKYKVSRKDLPEEDMLIVTLTK